MAYSDEVRRLAKAANQRMVRLEKAGVKSPAYQSAQGILAAMGRRKGRAAGRRFSETGKGTEKELAQQEKMLRRFLEGQKTSGLSGAREWRRNVLDSAKERFPGLSDVLTDDEYLQIFERLPDEEKDRVYGSEQTVRMVMTAVGKAKKSDSAYDINDIIDKIQSASDLKTAMNSIGITWQDMSTYAPLAGNG